ncbi:two-component sensor histidine kinase [Methylovirgula ligni]|uniref:histidine kinase n=1 Tax=Methylovirgula ligni TaxID=569860 RepID=A0A3D9YPP5_9HYPH|nr:ActS/PrrB/RegB family redox-sensitive histidine kinase [Methylovirgula ligni]QAY94996.1 two-component sensor histidine kinase [Methylovirgula ligni]REF84547.1 two-component system sensor histidine kinase RegB [Methylovirgula ligni]
MTDSADLDLGRRSRRLHVDTLVKLRWLAVFGQLAAVLLVRFGLGFPIPLSICLLFIAGSAWLNIVLGLRYRRSDRLDDRPAAAILAYDIIQLAALLYLTGGIENPFAVLFLAPVMIAAVSFSARTAIGLFVLMVIAATTISFFHHPLPWAQNAPFQLPWLYSLGIWAAVTVSAAFTVIYASRIAEETRKLADAFAATELIIAREQLLTQLDGLAAAAAHELGTPLATISIAAKELHKQLPAGLYDDDVSLIIQEIGRCRSILGKLSSLNEDAPGALLQEVSLDLLLEEAVAPNRGVDIAINIVKNGSAPEPVTKRNPGLIYGLGNLIENATDFAKSEVRVIARWNKAIIEITIEDDGPGFSPDVIDRIGEPYITTRAGRHTKHEADSGLGLGLFIAKTLLERSGATVITSNRLPPQSGARITIRWPRTRFDTGVAPHNDRRPDARYLPFTAR